MSADLSAVRYRRCRFLVMVWTGVGATLIHSQSLKSFQINGATVDVLSALGTERSIDSLRQEGLIIRSEQIHRLVDAGLVHRVRANRKFACESTYWDSLELLVHRRTTRGGYDPSVVANRSEEAPSVRKDFRGRFAVQIQLPPPRQLVSPLGAVLKRRRTERDYSSATLTLDDLSNLLYHAARVEAVSTDALLGEVVLRPYPTGGARSELEIYIVCNEIEAMRPGLYYYDPFTHELGMLSAARNYRSQLNDLLRQSTGNLMQGIPPGIVMVTAVVGRTMWKYQNLGLSLVYKDTGCLIQTIYLVGTALGLGVCVVGRSFEDMMSSWVTLDPVEESHVASIAIGRCPGAGSWNGRT